MTTRIQLNQLKGIIIILLFIVLVFHSATSQAQSTKALYKGIGVSFGLRSFKISSDIAAIHNLSVVEEGGSAAFIYGNDLIKTRAFAGFYYSASAVKHTVDMFQAGASSNFYPLTPLKSRPCKLDIYLSSGFTFNKYKFAGHYLNPERMMNYSTVNDNYIGSVIELQVTAGIGVEYRLLQSHRDFLHLFAEVTTAAAIATQSKSEAFKNTTTGNQSMLSIGVRFGALRVK